jgi:hypothetical protein
MRSKLIGIAGLPWILTVIAFWLSASLVLDLLVMPVMYTSGMMAEPSFATAGYSLFEAFNHVELVCAALILTGLLTLRMPVSAFKAVVSGSRCRWALGTGAALLCLALVYTYGLTPWDGSLGHFPRCFCHPARSPDRHDLDAWGLLGAGNAETGGFGGCWLGCATKTSGHRLRGSADGFPSADCFPPLANSPCAVAVQGNRVFGGILIPDAADPPRLGS